MIVKKKKTFILRVEPDASIPFLVHYYMH